MNVPEQLCSERRVYSGTIPACLADRHRHDRRCPRQEHAGSGWSWRWRDRCCGRVDCAANGRVRVCGGNWASGCAGWMKGDVRASLDEVSLDASIDATTSL